MERPENALSYSEYKELQKQKKQLLGENKPKVHVVPNSDLQFRQRQEEEVVTTKKRVAKNKPVKVNREEQELNKLISEKLTITNEPEENREFRKYEKYDRPTYNQDRQYNQYTNKNYNKPYRTENKVNKIYSEDQVQNRRLPRTKLDSINIKKTIININSNNESLDKSQIH